MPNDNTTVCGCGVVLDLPKTRNGMTAISTRNYTILIPKSLSASSSSMCGAPGGQKANGGAASGSNKPKKPGGPHSRASDSGSTSSVAEQSGRRAKSNKKDKRLNPARRSRSAERAESHYTYIDSGSSSVSIHRESPIAEALYCTIDGEDEEPVRPSNNAPQQPQQQQQPANNVAARPPYAIPSMTSPPPTYDVAIAKNWQTGLPPSYEEYLCHKHALLTRSHTPPPPWTDTSNSTSLSAAGANSASLEQISRELLASQPELRDYLTQLALQGGAEQAAHHYHQLLLQQQALRKQAARPAQRSRAMPPRSQSESRAQQQQRIATMYEDGAWCMETTAIQSAFENGVAFCSLM